MSRKLTTVLVTVWCIILGIPSSLGFGPLSGVHLLGMDILDFMDFLTNTVMMPVLAFATCIFVGFVLKPQKLIREALEIADSIPPGRVMSYGQIAALMGRPKNARLVGKIMSMQDRFGDHPCHRVVNSAGRTVPGWMEQRELLEAEGVEFKENGNVDMNRFRVQ